MTKVYVPDFGGSIQEVDTAELQWRPSVYAIVIKDDSVLTIRYKNGKYDVPGGGIKFGEMPTETLLREVKEETGITVSSPTLLEVKSTFFRHANNVNTQTIMTYYAVSLTNEVIIEPTYDPGFESDHVEGPVWLPLALLPEVETASTVDWRDIVTAHLQ